MFIKTILFNASKKLNRNFQKEFGKLYFKKSANLFIYLNNSNIAKRICEKISNDLSDKDVYIFEASPGTGVLTEQLLQHKAKVRVFEPLEKPRREILAKFQDNYGDKLEIVDKQILG